MVIVLWLVVLCCWRLDAVCDFAAVGIACMVWWLLACVAALVDGVVCSGFGGVGVVISACVLVSFGACGGY